MTSFGVCQGCVVDSAGGFFSLRVVCCFCFLIEATSARRRRPSMIELYSSMARWVGRGGHGPLLWSHVTNV